MGLIGFGPAWDLGRAIAGASRKATRDRYATVTRRDPDGVTWGTIAGASGEVPLGGSLADAEVGDVVAVDWRGGVPVASGNATSPSVGARQVEGAVAPVRAASAAAQGAARAAQSVADAAQRVAEAVGQHFFADSSGIHVTEAAQDEWETSHTGANVLLNSVGQLFRDGLNNLLTLTTEGGARALTVWDGLGNAAGNVRAVIGETITLGSSEQAHTTIGPNYCRMEDASGRPILDVNVYNGSDGLVVTSATFVNNSAQPPYLVGATFPVVEVVGLYEVISGGFGPLIEVPTVMQIGNATVFRITSALTVGSTYEVQYKTDKTLFTATLGTRASEADGWTYRAGACSVALGSECIASAGASIAAGEHAVSNYKAQAALGRYNEIDPNGDYALIIGNGTSDSARSNAFAVKWDGSPLIKQSAAWRSALGMARSTSSVTPQNSTWAYQYCYANAVMGMVTCNQLRVSSALANGSSVTIGTVPSGYRPPYNVYATVCSTSASAQGGLFVLIDSNGVVTLYNRSGSQLGTGTNLYFTVTYAI